MLRGWEGLLCWLGCAGARNGSSKSCSLADATALLPPAPLQDERVLAQLAGALQAELAAEAGGAQEEAAQGPVELD